MSIPNEYEERGRGDGQETEDIEYNGNRKLSNYNEIYASLAVAFSAVSAGSVLSWTSAAGAILLKNDGRIPYRVTLAQMNLMVTLLPIGAIIGSLTSGFIAQTLGRRFALQGMAVPCIVGWLLVLLGKSVWWLYFGRILGGMAVGIVYTIAMVYIAEVSQASMRGLCCSLVQIGFSFGIMFAYAVNVLSKGNFYLLTACCAVLPFISSILLALVPDTPQFHFHKHHYVQAAKTLQWLRGDEEDIEDEYDALRVAEEEKDKATLLKDATTRKAFFISATLLACQQLSGINTVLMNMENIAIRVGAHPDSSTIALIVEIVMFLSACIMAGIVDKVDRKILMFISTGLMGLMVLNLTLCLVIQHYITSATVNWLAFSFLLLYASVYNLGMGPLSWVLMAELMPQKIRGPACGLVSAICWILCTCVSIFFYAVPYLIASYSLYTVCCFLTLVFIRYHVPETMGYTLDEIQTMIRR